MWIKSQNWQNYWEFSSPSGLNYSVYYHLRIQESCEEITKLEYCAKFIFFDNWFSVLYQKINKKKKKTIKMGTY